MRIHTRRRTAVTIATLTAALLLGVVSGAVPALAADPPGLERFMHAVARVESGGDHRAVNRTSGAYGRYQIMPVNWPTWARRYLGDAGAKPTPANQEKVAKAKMTSLYRWLGTWRRVSYWWLTGSDRTSSWSRAATDYVTRVMAYFGGGDQPETAETAETAGTRYSERSSTISYTGSWQSARHGDYAGGAVRYASGDGATAAITFTGSRIAWYGPVGPTRGKARVLIDGVAVKTVDLKRPSFQASANLYSVSWKETGRHTFAIEVIATPGDRLVAIDELAVTE